MWRITYFLLLAAVGTWSLTTPYAEAVSMTATVVFAILPAAFYLTKFLLWLARERPERPFAAMRLEPSLRALDRSVLFVSSCLFAVWLPPIKESFPNAHGFWADPWLAHADRILLGTDAWRLTTFLQPITPGIDYLYGLWPVTVSAASILIALFASEKRLSYFFLGIALIWTALGIALASILASAGPIFGPELGFGFTDLRQAMSNAYYSIPAHEYLWAAYVSHSVRVGAGISAAPSMHCAITFLMAFVAFRTRWFIPAVVYAAFIWIGSVHLGWHYFVDGLLSLAGVSAIWFALRLSLGGISSSSFPPLIEVLAPAA